MPAAPGTGLPSGGSRAFLLSYPFASLWLHLVVQIAACLLSLTTAANLSLYISSEVQIGQLIAGLRGRETVPG